MEARRGEHILPVRGNDGKCDSNLDGGWRRKETKMTPELSVKMKSPHLSKPFPSMLAIH